jgi:hypothetical protein
MSTPQIVTGDDFVLPVYLTANDVAYPVTGATITVAVVGTDHESLLSASQAQSSSAAGANWATGLVAVELAAALTAAIYASGAALLEIQVATTTKLSWFVPVEIVKGHIA